MTCYDLWIGPPHKLGPEMAVPSGDGAYGGEGLLFHDGRPAFSVLRNRIKDGTTMGQQLDWGSYGAVMTRQQAEAFLLDIYGEPGRYEARCSNGLDHVAERMRKLRAFLAAIPPKALVGVSVSEF